MKNIRNRNAPPSAADQVQTYLQSSWDIVIEVYNELPALVILAAALPGLTGYLKTIDIDTLVELNAIVTDATFGDFANQTQAEAGIDNTTTMTPLRVAQAIAVLASGLQNKYDGTVPPGVNDDSGAGYSVGSVWIDIVASPHESYRCTDASVGAAVWIHTTLTSDQLATVGLTGDSDDLIEGSVKLLLTVAERALIALVDQTFTATEKTKLTNIETAATADQSDAEIETAYNNQVPVVTQGDAEAGTSTTRKGWTAERVKQAIVALGGGGGGVTWDSVSITTAVTAGTGTVFYDLAAIVNAELPTSPTVDDVVWLVNNDDSGYNVQVDAGGTNELHDENVAGIPELTLTPGDSCIAVCFDAGATKKWHFTSFSNAGAPDYSALNKVVSTTTYTIIAGDEGYNLVFTHASGCAVTLPDTLDTDFQCSIIWAGTVKPVVTPGTDTINGAGAAVEPAAIWKAMYLTQYAATEWLAIL